MNGQADPNSQGASVKNLNRNGQGASLVFAGTGSEFAETFFKTMLLTLITGGIYFFWAVAKQRQYLWSKMNFQGKSFNYHGNGKEVFVAYIKCAVAFVIYMGVFNGLASIATSYKLQQLLILAPPVLLLLAAGPIVFFAAFRYRLSKTSWNGMQFEVFPDYKGFWKLSVKNAVLTGLTLGIYSPWAISSIIDFVAQRTSLGSARFRFTASGGSLAKTMLSGMFFTMITVGLYGPWFAAKLWNTYAANLWLGDEKSATNFSFNRSGGQLLGFLLLSYLKIIVTLGIATPWVMIKAVHFFTEGIHQNHQVNIVPNAAQNGAETNATLIDRVAEAVAG